MKKKILKTLMAVVMMFLPLVAPAVNTIIHTAYYNSATIGTDTLGGVTYATVHYEGLYNGGAPGTPSLPVDYIRFSVPYNATNFTVTAQPKNTYSLGLNYPVYPCQEPRMMSDTTPVVITLPDSAAYYSGSDYPTQRAWVVDEGFLAGENHIVTVAVMPFAYRYSASGFYRHTFKESRSVRLTLSYELSDSLAIYPIVRNDSILRQEGYVLTQSMVANPSSVIANAPVEMTMDSLIFINPNQGDGLNGGDKPTFPSDSLPTVDPSIVNGGSMEMAEYKYPYLIVTTSDLEHSVRRIAALKRQKGYNVKVATMDEVLNSPFSLGGDRIKQEDGTYLTTFTDNAGKLRQFLKHYFINHGTKFVLLAGKGVPFRSIKMRVGPAKNDSVPTSSDLYFGDINGDWFTYKIDYQQELYVGRIIAQDQDQIINYTDKLLRYILNPGNHSYGYLKRILYSQGYDFVNSGEVYSVRKKMDSIFPEQSILSESSVIHDFSKYPSGENIVDSINTHQFGFISLHHHGFPAGLITYGYRSGQKRDSYRFLWAIDSVHIFTGDPYGIGDDPSTTNGLNNLSNKYFPSICYSTGCSTIPFVIMPGYENAPMNFGESFTTGKDYGGPAFLGNTTDAWSPTTGELEKLFASYLTKGYYHIGEANGVAKSVAPSYLSSYGSESSKHVPITQNLLGDPEFEIWTDIPQLFTNVSLSRSDNSITINGIDSDSTIVAYYSNDGQIGTDTISTSSVVFNNISPNSTVMLYKHNNIPYIAPLDMQNITFSKNQYVIASDVNAGKAIDSLRTNGNVIVPNGIEYEIEASGTVTLQDGFKVEKGATFAVYPSSF